ncbi:MAG TPA: alpha-amylase family glycosyl hydrolase [bacterium]|nr:alpha-amylase family glycosyl hydrolase [bacterium]
MKGFIFLFLLSVLFSCEKTDDTFVSCGGTVISVSGRAEDDLYVKSSFNGWSLSTPMIFKDGKWSVELFLKPGDYPYSIYSAKSKKSFPDIENPLTMFDKSVRYSRLTVSDCKYPKIELVKRPVINGMNILFEIKYNAGISGSYPDLEKSVIKLNNEVQSYQFDKKSGTFSINFTAPEKGKYIWYFKIYDTDGFASEVLTVPVWMEEKEFRWEDAFIYQIMTDRFHNGDKTNDKPLEDIDEKANWQGGDYAGIIKKIDENYFLDMGVNVIWISSPVKNTDNPGKGMGGDTRYYSAYHSYWPVATGWSDTFQIPGLDSPFEKRFGTAEELKELIQKAHKKGIRVMLDFVPNHVHTDSYLWETYKNLGWFHMASYGQPANANGGYTCGWEHPVECWFTDYLADIDYRNIDAMNNVIDHLIWLITEFDIDGLRLDAIRLMIIDFTTTLKTAIQRKVTTTGIPFYMIGETFTGDTGWDEIGFYIGERKLDGQFDFPLYHHIVRTFLLQSEVIPELVEFLEENDERYKNDFYELAVMGNFIGNHDVARALSVANKDFDGVSSSGGDEAHEKVWENSPVLPETEEPFKKMRNALTFLFATTGIPVIYQGDEYGMPGANDPDNRRMVLFGDDLSDLQKKNLEHTQILGKFRAEKRSLRYGIRKNIAVTDNFYAFAMVKDGETVIAAFNNSNLQEVEKIDVSNLSGVEENMKGLFSDKIFNISEGSIEIELEPFSSELFYIGE